MKDIHFLEYRSGLPGTPDLEKASSHLPASWLVYRRQLVPKYFIVWRDIFICYLFLFLSIVLLFTTNSWPLALFMGLWLGYWLHSLSLFLHEAVHYNIHPDKKWNDLLANLLIYPLPFIDVQSYRKIHWSHHLYLGSPQDTEKSYFNALHLGFLLQAATGIHAIKMLFYYFRINGEKTERDWKGIFRLVITQSFILGGLFWGGYYWIMLAWFLGTVIFWPFFGTVRQILRHRDESADSSIDYNKTSHGPTLRLFGNDFISRTFGNAGFNMHLLHHWDPIISYTRLKDMEEYFKKTELAPLIEHSRTSYWKFLWRLLKQK